MAVNESVAVIHLPRPADAYQAISELRQLDGTLASVEVRGAAVVERLTDGTLRIPEQGDAVIGTGTATGGLVGMLIGVLGGPLGMLLGFGTGVLVGGVFDLDRASSVEAGLALLSGQVPPGSTAVIAELRETTPEPLDQLASRFGTTVQRQPVEAVAAEVEVVAAAAEAAQKEANRVLRQHKRAEGRARLEHGVDAVKEKLHIG